MLKNLRSNDNGMVLLTVLIVVLTMMVLVIAIINIRVSSISLVENEIKEIQAETLARGALAYIIANQYAGGNSASFELIEDLGQDFTMRAIIDFSSSGLGGTTNILSVNIYY
jgi:hypothetical protein